MFRAFLAASLPLLLVGTAWGGVGVLPGSSPQVRSVGEEFAPVRVRVTDARGLPAPGATLSFSLHMWHPLQPLVPPGSVSAWTCRYDAGLGCSSTTDSNGEGLLPTFVTVGPGTYTVTVSASMTNGPSLGSADVTYIAEPLAAPPQLAVHRGNGQSVVSGGRLEPFVVRFVDGQGKPIAGAGVTFSANSGPKLVAPSSLYGSGDTEATTDAEGYAQSPPYFATRALGNGRVAATARVPGGHLGFSAAFEYRVTTASGAVSLDLQDMWWAGKSESGWAISIAQEGHLLFPVLYAYDADGEPTWYVGFDSSQGTPDFRDAYQRYFFNLFSPRSAPFHAYDAGRFQLGPSVMALTFIFESASSLQLGIALPAPQVGPVKQLVRQDFTSDVPAPITGLAGMWWGGPEQNGWGISLMEQPGGLFAVWATYGDDGKPTWFVMDSGTWTSDLTWEGRIVRPSGPRWPDFDKSRLRLDDVGTFRFEFQDRTRATFTWAVGVRTAVQAIERMPL